MAPRPILSAVALAFLLHASAGNAEPPPPGTTTAAVVAATTASQTAPQPAPSLFGDEPEAWKNPATGSTSRLFSQCEHVGEMILFVDRARAWVTVNLENLGSSRSEATSRDARIRFVGADVVRAPDRDAVTEISLDPGWRQAFRLVFPEKGDLRGTKRLRIELPIKLGDGSACTITTDFDRYSPEAQPQDEYTEYTKFDLYFGVGPRLLLTGGQDRIGSHGASIALGFDFFRSIHWGGYVDILIEPHGNRGVATVLGRAPTVDPTVVTAGGFSAGWSFRLVALPWLHASYGLGPTLYFADLIENGDSKEEAVAFAFNQRVRLDAFFASLSDGSRFALGTLLYHLLPVSGRLGQTDVSGSSVGLLFTFTVAG